METKEDLEKRIEQINKEEFEAAVKQTKLGNFQPNAEFINRISKQKINSSNINNGRIGLLLSFETLIESDNSKLAASIAISGLAHMLGVEKEITEGEEKLEDCDCQLTNEYEEAFNCALGSPMDAINHFVNKYTRKKRC